MNTKIIAGAVIGIIAVGGLSFFAGTKVASSDPRGGFGGRDFPAGAQERFGQMGQMGPGGMARGGVPMGGGFVAGEIISKDERSITVSLQDGGSRIIFLTENTPVSKQTSSSIADLSVGEQVMVTGSTNQDGSVSAQSVQVGALGGPMMMRPGSN